jgi:methionyl-tRNA formyltransferase
MRLLLFSGSHARHIYVHEQMIKSDKLDVVGIVSMERESTLPTPPPDWSAHDRNLFNHHFNLRDQVEASTYGDRNEEEYDEFAPTLFTDRNGLNSERVAKFVREIDADASFIFGTGLIFDPVLSALPKWRLNFHLGLSPWYKGSATLFWPFYFLEPQLAGGTLHQIIPEPDAGGIVHHSVPELIRGQGIHETTADVVVNFAKETRILLEYLADNNSLPIKKQTRNGKLFLSNDFNPPHLRTIYDLYNNEIVDEYLNDNLGTHQPKLIDAFETLGISQT